MEKKYMTTYYNKIESICDFSIDCKQGLYLSMLHCFGKTIFYTGARWPWTFYYKPSLDSFDIEANKVIDIVNLLTIDSIKKLYNIDLEYHFFYDYTDMVKYIRYSISNDIPVIVNSDQYYIPYHYEHIYLHKHGLHATLLLGYDDNKGEVFCFSVTPKYKGVITQKVLRESIKNSSILWCATLKNNIEPWIEKNDETVFENFQNNIREVAMRYTKFSPRHLESNMKIYTKDILFLLLEYSNLNDDEVYENFKKLCDGRWGWEINTNINLFIKYLLSDYVNSKYRNTSDVLQTIEEYKIKWDITYRKMFKMLIRKPRNINKEVDIVIKDFYVLVEFENKILDQLII